ncbi:MAG: hypothetical protein AAF560_17965 [Acidobacteriota bacterium]
MSQPTIDPDVAQAVAEGLRAATLEHHDSRMAQYGAHPQALSACPEVHGPFFCSATIHVTAVSLHEVKVEATILYPKNRRVIIEGTGHLGVHLASDGVFHVAGILGPDPDQMVGDVAFSLGGAATGIGPVNFAIMKPGCFVGDMIGVAFITGAFAITGKGTARLG